MQASIELLLDLVDEAFEGPAWHGPSLRESLRRITAAQAAWRPAPGRHSIRELTIHAAYWKHVVRGRLTGTAPGSFPLEGSNWFRAAPSRTWDDDVRLLVAEHRRLRQTIGAYSARALDRPIDAKKQTAAFTIRGIAAHDLYHAGQIRLLRALQGGKGRKGG